MRLHWRRTATNVIWRRTQAKFRFFVGHIARMDVLFEASFSPLSSSGERRTRLALLLPFGSLRASRQLHARACAHQS